MIGKVFFILWFVGFIGFIKGFSCFYYMKGVCYSSCWKFSIGKLFFYVIILLRMNESNCIYLVFICLNLVLSSKYLMGGLRGIWI